MSNINNILGQPIAEYNAIPCAYVGLPGVGLPFTVHPTDKTAEDKRIYLFYSRQDRCTYAISPAYPNIKWLFDDKTADLSEAILYRGIYNTGVEFIIPLACYQNRYQLSVQAMLADARQGQWLVRNPDKKVSYNPYDSAQFDYDISQHVGPPEWSNRPFDELIMSTFKHRIIDGPDHPVAREQFRSLRNKSGSHLSQG